MEYSAACDIVLEETIEGQEQKGKWEGFFFRQIEQEVHISQSGSAATALERSRERTC